MKRFSKIYFEISNVCNLSCSFCPGTSREPHMLSRDEFRTLLSKITPYTDYVYFHLMGEPLLHPELGSFLNAAADAGLHVILTTNGTLLPQRRKLLWNAPALHKVNVSLHSFEANQSLIHFDTYLKGCFEFAIGKPDFIVCYRLWNSGGADRKNAEILDTMHRYFLGDWKQERSGIEIGSKIFLQEAEKFDWPDPTAPDYGSEGFCYGLRDQIGVLADGTVVPCCLDSEGRIALGNLYRQSMDEILDSDRARKFYRGFSERKTVEPLCRHCGYALRFHKKR